MALRKKDKNIPLDIYTGHYWDAVLIKYLLQDKGIEVSLKNDKNVPEADMFKFLMPMDTVMVVISNLDYEKAKVIVSEYVKNSQKDIFDT